MLKTSVIPTSSYTHDSKQKTTSPCSNRSSSDFFAWWNPWDAWSVE